MSLLAGMEQQEALGRQAFEVLASRRRASRRERRAAVEAAHGGERGGEEEPEEEEGGEEGLGGASGDRAGPSHHAQHSQEEGQEHETVLLPSGKARPRRRAKADAAGAGGQGGAFGASVAEIWDDELAEQMGLQPAKSRKKQRARERWRKKAAAKGGRRRDIPEDVAAALGEANLLYAMGQHHEAIAKLMEVGGGSGKVVSAH